MVLTEKKIYDGIPSGIDTSWLIHYLYKSPFTHKHIAVLRSRLKVTDTILAYALNITPKTLQTYSRDVSKIKVDTKEHIILLISLFKHGKDVFGSDADFLEWLTSENLVFDHRKPVDFLNTISGLKFVDDRLTAIEYGDTA